MKLRLILILGILFGFQLAGLYAQSHKKAVFDAYKSGNIPAWQAALADMEVYARKVNNLSVWLDLAESKYGLVGYCIGSGSCSDVEGWIDGTESILDAVLDQEPQNARAKSLYGGLLAMKISLSPAKALYLGPRSKSYLEEAVAEGVKEPSAWVELGNMHYHAPALFGGDMDKAIDCFEKAVNLFQKDTKRSFSWQYLHAIAWLGQAYESQGRYEDAYKVYVNVLKSIPDFQWIRDELYPACKMKIKS